MASRTDARARMVSAGQDLLSERGYGVTLLDVIERAGAPRGSIYYHFPQGKPELALEVARKVQREIEVFVARTAERVPDPAAFLQRLVEHHRKRLTTSDYALGCPLMGMVVTGDSGSEELEAAIASGFDAWVAAIADALTAKGVQPAAAQQLATLTVTGIEGAIIVARGRRNPQPFAVLSRSIPLLVAGALDTPAP